MNGFELLKVFPDFSVCSGGEGLNEEIYTVTVMDAPDIYMWMHGNEFLITSGYVFKHNPELFGDLIIKLKDRNVSALGIKVDRFIKKLPESVVELSNNIKFPIIHIPDHYAFSEIIDPALAKILADNYIELKKSEEIHMAFARLGIYGREINDILKLLCSILNKSVMYLNYKDKEYYTCGEVFKNIDYNDKVIIDDLEKSFYSFKVIFQNDIYGKLLIGCHNEDLKSLDLRTIDHAAWMIKFYTQMKISNNHIIRKHKDEFIHDLLYNNIKTIEEAQYRAKLHGWKIEGSKLSIIFDIDNYKQNYLDNNYKLNVEQIRDSIFELIISRIRKEYRNSYYLTRSDGLVFLISTYNKDKYKENKKLISIFNMIKEELYNKYYYTVTIGIGNFYDLILDTHKSYSESLISVKIGRNLFGENSINFYHDIAVYWELSKISETNYERNSILQKIVNLAESDKEYNTYYYDTLKEIVKNDWNLSQTSQSLYIHYNTIKYRFNKIKELLGSEIQDRNDKFDIELGIKIYEIIRLRDVMELMHEM